MEKIREKLLVGLTGILVGLATYYLMYGWYDVFPWAIVALAVGYLSKNRNNSLINGAIFGYFLFLVYIYAGYKGKTDTVATIKFILFDIVFSLVGAIAGAVGGLIGYWFKQKLGE